MSDRGLQVSALSFVPATEFPDLAVAYEAAGWDGLLAADSQNLTGDPFAAISVAGARTSWIRLGTGVTNPVTRHPSALAAAAATAQAFTDGRMVLGIGRGDSALSHLGRPPVSLTAFEKGLRQLRGYLRDGRADLDGFTSRMPWVRDHPPVPIEVTASGPRAVAIGALYADRLALTVGVDPDAIALGLDRARTARVAAGLDPDGIEYGAYLNVATHTDLEVARDLVSGSLSVLARFADRRPASPVHASYSKDTHADTRGRGERPADLEAAFAIVDTPQECVRRIQELVDLGLDFVNIAGHSRNAPRDRLLESAALFGRDVIPALTPARPRAVHATPQPA